MAPRATRTWYPGRVSRHGTVPASVSFAYRGPLAGQFARPMATGPGGRRCEVTSTG
jgi:hypothetical protein